MAQFDYNRAFPCPTDGQVLDIYRRFRELKETAVSSWKRGVTKGLLGQREYRDLECTRLKMVQTSKGFLPILSCKPVIADDLRELLELHATFLTVYDAYREAAITLINVVLDQDQNDQETFRYRQQVNCAINSLKIVIAMMKTNIFTVDLGQQIVGGATPHFLATAAVQLGIGPIISPDFSGADTLLMGHDSQLIGAFYHHVRCLREAGQLDAF